MVDRHIVVDDQDALVVCNLLGLDHVDHATDAAKADLVVDGRDVVHISAGLQIDRVAILRSRYGRVDGLKLLVGSDSQNGHKNSFTAKCRVRAPARSCCLPPSLRPFGATPTPARIRSSEDGSCM